MMVVVGKEKEMCAGSDKSYGYFMGFMWALSSRCREAKDKRSGAI